jgi:ParB family chromosome partitioning protein
MKLAHYDSGKLALSKTNMRHSRKRPDVSDILPSVKARGILVPLIVRPIVGGDEDAAEIVAGYRRWTADALARTEGIDHGPLPCAVLEPGDDAAAVEASLLENIARLDPDEVAQWETFVRLTKEGRTIEQIGQTFGLTDLYVRRILALGDLHPRLRALYRAGEIDARTARHLTLASKARQKEWLALRDDADSYAPLGSHLRAWLLGGAEISTKAALFPLEDYRGQIVTDLFGENGYFADAEQFWTLQNQAIAARTDVYRAEGWHEIELLQPGDYFHSYEYEKTPKAKGGKIYVSVRHSGEVEFHEGWLSGREARKARAQAAKAAPPSEDGSAIKTGRPETTSALQRYVDLHRHAAVRAVLLDFPGVGLRLMVAHAIAGSVLWTVRTADQRGGRAETDESLETSRAETLFDACRREALALLGFSPEAPTLAGGNESEDGIAAIFTRLAKLEDDAVLSILAVVMGETLAIDSALVDLLGVWLKVDMAALWQADDAFFEPLRDRRIVNAMLRDIAGKKVADANLTEKVKTQKEIIRDHLDGTNARKKVEGWVPKWLAFPPDAYAGRPFPTLDRYRSVAALMKRLPPCPSVEATARWPEEQTAPVPDTAEPNYAIAAE